MSEMVDVIIDEPFPRREGTVSHPAHRSFMLRNGSSVSTVHPCTFMRLSLQLQVRLALTDASGLELEEVPNNNNASVCSNLQV